MERAAAKKVGCEYKCIFFDLDHTLWDYECNSRETLADLHNSFGLGDRGIPFDDFFNYFTEINSGLWSQYDQGLISHKVIRLQRFRKVLSRFGIDGDDGDELNDRLSHGFLYECPKKTALLPHAREILEYLAPNYALTLVTNGFEEIQVIKLQSGNITHYFNHVITSQKAGHKKPAREIFDYALYVNGLERHEVIMIGDNLATDIRGARNASIDTVFYNPQALSHQEEVVHEIRCLSELQDIL